MISLFLLFRLGVLALLADMSGVAARLGELSSDRNRDWRGTPTGHQTRSQHASSNQTSHQICAQTGILTS